MNFLYLLLALSITLSTSPLLAMPVGTPDPFFSCTTESNATLELKKESNQITYAFGRPGSPHALELKRSPEDVDVSLGSVSGSELSNSITFTNGAYTYTVISKINRIADAQEPKHGIIVKKDSTYLTYISCIPASVIGSLLDIE